MRDKGKLELKNRLKVARAEKQINQSNLAKIVGVSRQTISNIETYEQGRGSPGAELSNRICIYFGITIEQLFNQKLTPEDLAVTGRIRSIAEVEVESVMRENELLRASVTDLRAQIKLLKRH